MKENENWSNHLCIRRQFDEIAIFQMPEILLNNSTSKSE